MADDYVWTKRPDEGEQAYKAFQHYLHLGPGRTGRQVARDLEKTISTVDKWSQNHAWRDRAHAYEVYLSTAATDGLVHQLAESRDKNLALMDKLRDHLSRRLDTFIERQQDPSMLWTNALTAMAKVEQNSLLMGEKTLSKASEGVSRVEKLIERMEALAGAEE